MAELVMGRSKSGAINAPTKNTVPREEFDDKYQRLTGDLQSLRTQFTEMNKKLMKIPSINNEVKLDKLSRDFQHLKEELHRNYVSHKELSAKEVQALKNDLVAHSHSLGQVKLDLSKAGSHDALQKLFQEHQQMKAQVGTLQQSSAGSVQALQTTVQTLQTNVQELQRAMQASAQETQRTLQSQSQSVGQLQQALKQSQASDAALKSLQSGFQQLQQTFQQLQQTSQQTKGALDQLQSSSKQTATEMQQVKSESGQLKQEISKVGELGRDVAKAKNDMTQELSTMKQEFSTMKTEVNKAKQVAEAMTKREKELDQKAERMKQNLEQEIKKHSTALESAKKDLQSNKTELQGATKKQQQHEREIMEVKKMMRVADEFYALKTELNNLGVLKPPKVEVAEDAPPPVGTIELADDCFTARLLTKLRYIKARAEKHAEMKAEREAEGSNASETEATSSDAESVKTYDSEAFEIILKGCENVTGLGEPEIAEGGHGYNQVTYGWTVVCICTLTLQIIIVTVLVKYAENPTECFDHDPTGPELLVLHGSKALAVIAAGALMAKDFMDIVNESMVSILVEPRVSWDTAVMSFCRFSLTCLIGLANVMLFEGMVSPLSVWINMAALAFVGEMGGAVAEQGKKGVFGHHIRAQLTSLNYELTFVSDYPWWIPIVQTSTLTFVALFVIIGAYIAAAAPDAMCED